jgi:serine/threonine-protein kinase 24/25/MST4
MLLKHSTLSEEHCAVIMIQLLHCLKYFHTDQKILKNLKPGNIYLSGDGSVKLFDYIIGPKFSQSFNKCKSIFVSNPFYLAPEVVRGTPNQLKSDLWSLGITCYELAMGSLPYRKFTPTKALFEIVNKPSPTLPNTKNFSSNLRHFINRCLVKDVPGRADIDELLETTFIANAKSKGLLIEL